MKITDLQDGGRVRTIREIEIYPLGLFPAGLTGTVHDVDLTQPVIAYVKMDVQFASLAPWENCLQVWRDDTEGGDCTLDAFATIPRVSEI